MQRREPVYLCLTLTAFLWLATVRAGIPQGISQDIPQLEESPSAQPESELLSTNTPDLGPATGNLPTTSVDVMPIKLTRPESWRYQ